MKGRKLGTGRDPMTKFQQADEMDARSIRAFVNDPKSWNPLYLYHAPGVPTFAGAVLSAPQADLSTFDQSKAVIKQCQGGDFTVHVTVANALMAPVVEVGLDLTLSPSWLVGSPLVTPCDRMILSN